MGMGVIHSQQAGSHCGFEKFSPLRGPLTFRIKFFKICILAKQARLLTEVGPENLERLRRVGRRAELGEDVRRRTRRQHLHDGGHERARRRARDTPPTGEPRQGTGALRDPTGREYREW